MGRRMAFGLCLLLTSIGFQASLAGEKAPTFEALAGVATQPMSLPDLEKVQGKWLFTEWGLEDSYGSVFGYRNYTSNGWSLYGTVTGKLFWFNGQYMWIDGSGWFFDTYGNIQNYYTGDYGDVNGNFYTASGQLYAKSNWYHTLVWPSVGGILTIKH